MYLILWEGNMRKRGEEEEEEVVVVVEVIGKKNKHTWGEERRF